MSTPLDYLPESWRSIVTRDWPIRVSPEEMAAICPSYSLPNCGCLPDIMETADSIVFHKDAMPWDEIAVHPYFAARNMPIFTSGPPGAPGGQICFKGRSVARESGVPDGEIHFRRNGDLLVIVREATMRSPST